MVTLRDFQFATDDRRDSFLRRGVFSCYRPVPPATPLTAKPTRFHPDDWAKLTRYSHTNKRLAFDFYTSRYLQTSGQIYWSDSQLSAAYLDNYHADIDRVTGATVKGSEMITEIYVERTKLAAFMEDAREAFRAHRANVIYGTVRLIEKDDETFLAWARERYACIIFNLHVDHTPADVERAADTVRTLIDLGIRHGGSYYLTYHRWARRDQVERCYPQLPEFLKRKREFDPGEVFQSNWYRHYRNMLRAPRRPSTYERPALVELLTQAAALMFLRVAGQLVVRLRVPRWLPPMANGSRARAGSFRPRRFFSSSDFWRGSGV